MSMAALHGEEPPMPIICHIIVILLTVMCALAWGQEPQINVVGFQAWKEQQILEAQNQMLRTSSRITQVKSNKGSTGSAKEAAVNLPNSRIKKTADSDSVALAERDLKRAQESLETASGLQLDDYISIYLPTLQDQPEALNKLAEKLTKEELAAIFKVTYAKGPHAPDARRNNVSSLEGIRAKGF
jgi:hypothetical protein